MKEKTKKMQTKVCKLNKKSKTILITAILLAVVITVIAVSATYANRYDTVYSYGSERVRENAYRYWVACYKYEVLSSYRALDIEDSTEGWSREYLDGKSYDEVFSAQINREIALRLIAADIFDSYGENMVTKHYNAIASALENIEKYSYGEDVYDALKETYGVSRRDLKRIALYEQKYEALRAYLYGDTGAGVFADPFTAELEKFYKENYGRYNVICVEGGDLEANARRLRIEAAIARGMSAAEFSALEKECSDLNITGGDFPNGLYLTAADTSGETVNGFLSSRMGSDVLQAMFDLEKEGDTATVAKTTADGSEVTYYLMRYPLDEKAYNDNDNNKAFTGFTLLASRALYRAQLLEELEKVKDHGVAARYTLGTVRTSKNDNIIWFLARS